MKRIYIFGCLTRIFMLFSFLFVISLGIYSIIINVGNYIANIIAVCILFAFLVFAIYWQWTTGIFVKKDMLVFSLDLGKSKNNVRPISGIKSVEIEKEKHIGFNFIVTYKDGGKEKFFYKFYRVSFFEAIQYKRIQKKLIKLNNTVLSQA